MAELSAEDLRLLDAYWRVSNYIGAGQIFLKENPLLREPLEARQIKPRLLGHWGTTPGLNFIYTHLNRLIKRHGLSMMYIVGPGHGGAAILAQTYLEGSFTERHPDYTQDAEGLAKLFKEFSWPYGFSSHVDVSTPGAIHFGGELGYSLLHAYGAAFDNPELIVACIVGDGEMETGPCAASWQSNKFLDPQQDGAVLPVVHLNGYKIGNPTIIARLPETELEQYFLGLGYRPHFVEGNDPPRMHEVMAATLEKAYGEVRVIQQAARGGGKRLEGVPKWPVIVLRTPKGWTGPKFVDGKPIEDTWASHQVPIEAPDKSPERLKLLEDWLKSYRPEELFDSNGSLIPELRALPPTGTHRMGMNQHANGGELLKDLALPDWKRYAVEVPAPGRTKRSPTEELGKFLRDVLAHNQQAKNFRLFAPDELISNKLDAVLETTPREWEETQRSTDRWLGEGGRVIEVLSEHMLEGWLEAYLLTGRHGIFTSYEAFIHIVDSMFNQHAKWLKLAREIPWRAPIASLNYLLASHVWQQDHNGFTHQDPGFLDHVANKKPEVIRIYLPPDANCLLSVIDHCLRSRNYVNVTVAGKQETLQWLTADEAEAHCRRGASIWQWASDVGVPEVVIAGCGDVPTIEAMAAVALVREHLPRIKMRAVNVVDLMVLATEGSHPHALSDADYVALFPQNTPAVFAFHGYPALIHRLTSERPGSLHVRGYQEEGAATTPFDMTVLNRIDRFDLATDIIRLSGRQGPEVDEAVSHLRAKLQEHREYVMTCGEDMPAIRNWTWPAAS